MQLILPTSNGAPVESNDMGAKKDMTLEEVEASYHVVSRGHNPNFGEYLVVTDGKPRTVRGRETARLFANTDTASTAEIGSAGTRWRRLLGNEEYNPLLQGIEGITMYDKMRRSDASVRSALRLAKTPVLGARWSVEPWERENPEAEEQAEFINDALFHLMSITWDQVLQESLLMLDFGYYMFELVFKLSTWRGKPKWIWQKWAPRSPSDVSPDGWAYDDHGGPLGVFMYDWEGTDADLFIPIDKMAVFTYDREANNMEGISVLRSAYKHWYFKENLYKIDAIQKERHGIGIPVIKLPPGFTPTDKTKADELGRNLRTNETAHVVLPPNWELLFAKVEGNPVDAVKSIEHHDEQIMKNVQAQFMNTGAAASKEQEIDLFMKAMRFIADIIGGVINKHAIPQLIDYNWPGVERYPILKARRIGETNDLRTMSFALRNLIGSDVIRPDLEMERWARDELDAPVKDEATERIVVEPPGDDDDDENTTGGNPQQPDVSAKRSGGGSPTSKPGQDRSGGQ